MATTFGKAIRVLFVSLVYVAVYSAMQVMVEAAVGFAAMYRALPYTTGSALWYDFDRSVISKLHICSMTAILLTLAAYWAMGILRERRLRDELRFRSFRKTPVIGAVVLAVGLRLLVSLYSVASDYIPALRESVQGAPDISPSLDSALTIMLYLVLAIVIAPIFEEILFRGLVQTELLRGLPPSLSIFVSSLIFAAAHALLFQSVFAFFVGLAFGWCYYITKNLWVSAIVHIVFNATILVTDSFAKLSPPLMLTGAAAGAVMTVAGLIWIGTKKA